MLEVNADESWSRECGAVQVRTAPHGQARLSPGCRVWSELAGLDAGQRHPGDLVGFHGRRYPPTRLHGADRYPGPGVDRQHLVAAVTEQRPSRRDGQRGLPVGRQIATVTSGRVDNRRRAPSRISGSPAPQDSAIVEAVQRELSMSYCRALPVGIFSGVLIPFARIKACLAAAPFSHIFFRAAKLRKKSLGRELTIRTGAVARSPVAA